MKLSKYLMAAALFLFFLSMSAFARSKDSGSFTLQNPTKLGEIQLKPGNYQVRWSGSGNNVNVDVLKQRKTVATTQAKLIELPKASNNNAIETNSQTNQIQEIDFSGKRQALVISGS